MKSLKAKLDQARKVAEKFEFGTSEWESSMEIVRSLCEEISKANPVSWSDKEWKEMMSR
jgi:hypothetical protein